ncbi:uncharacterized protein LOC143540113 [Bidens hawaiensis]|uniref:uncharacterized protein LOC143540113 n=1 Tax=Bidens hawaiensis TaxID=980011 RepID=UPI00404AC435
MAVRIPYMPLAVNHNKPKSTSNMVFMLAQAGSQKGPSSHPIQIKANIKLQKVFEDESSGLVCYKDEKGEIICEGYDEGPRLHQQSLSGCSSHPRDGEAIVDRLKRSLLLVTKGASHG